MFINIFITESYLFWKLTMSARKHINFLNTWIYLNQRNFLRTFQNKSSRSIKSWKTKRKSIYTFSSSAYFSIFWINKSVILMVQSFRNWFLIFKWAFKVVCLSTICKSWLIFSTTLSKNALNLFLQRKTFGNQAYHWQIFDQKFTYFYWI